MPELSYEGLAAPLGREGARDVQRKKRSASEVRRELRALQSIDAHRATWRMRSFQFFGVKDCPTLWDELRRMPKAPVEPELRELGLLEQADAFAIVPGIDLAVNEQRDALLKAQRDELSLIGLFFEGLGQAEQLEGARSWLRVV